jgi:hypothetical protein
VTMVSTGHGHVYVWSGVGIPAPNIVASSISYKCVKRPIVSKKTVPADRAKPQKKVRYDTTNDAA